MTLFSLSLSLSFSLSLSLFSPSLLPLGRLSEVFWLDSSVAAATIEHIEDRTLFGLVAYIADKEIELMKQRDDRARQRSARERGQRAMQAEREREREGLSKKQTLEALRQEQKRRRGTERQKDRETSGSAGSTMSSTSGMSVSMAPPSSAGQRGVQRADRVEGGAWCRVKQAVQIHRDADAAAECVREGRSGGEGGGAQHRAVASSTLQTGETIQVLETKQERGRDRAAQLQYVRFSGGWIAHPNDGSVLVPCSAPRHAAARAASPPASAWRPSVSGSREQQAAALRDRDGERERQRERQKAPAIVASSKEQRAREKRLAELERWDDRYFLPNLR